ncbi:MAG: hypothetical protein M3Y48_07480 [Actinomycetota bacterium]|nr:hypothetical protein [Actinomycetota bacterium]
MSDKVSLAELDGQHPELLPARTVLSLFSAGDGGTGTNGGDAVGTLGLNVLNHPLIPGSGNAVGAAGMSADG